MRTRRLSAHHTVTERPAPRRRTPEPRPLVSPGTQGRTVEDARMSAEALILCVLGAGFVGLVVLLGHVARWFA